MKKVLRNIVCGLAAVNLVALAVSCSDGLDDDDPFVKGGVITNPNTGETGGNGTGDNVEYEKTSVMSSITDWNQGTSYEAQSNGSKKITAANGWGSVMANIPFQFDAGTLTGKTHIIIEMDASNFNFAGENADYPPFELKLEVPNPSNDQSPLYSKIISCQQYFNDGVAVIPLTDVEQLDKIPQFAINLRSSDTAGAITSYVILKNVYVAKEKTTTNNSAAEPNNGTGTENQQTTGGQTTATVTPYSTTNLTVTTVNNAYSASTHGIQAKVTVRVGDALKGLSKGDTFVVKMKGTASKAFAPQVYFMDNTDAGGYANLGAWGDTVNFTTEEFDISKEVTISEKAPTSDDADAFVFVIDYDESSATADLENVTFNFSEFSVTKK